MYLHKFLCKECHFDEYHVQPDNENPSSSSINEREDFGPFFESREQERENVNEWRTAIATDI